MIKASIWLIAIFLCLSVSALDSPDKSKPEVRRTISSQESDARIAKLAAEVRENKEAFLNQLSKNPIRSFDGKWIDLVLFSRGKKSAEYAKTDPRGRLRIINGKVISSDGNGTLLLSVDWDPEGKVFLKNYPEKVEAGMTVAAWAMEYGSHGYTSPSGTAGKLTIYDYGNLPDEKQMEMFQAELAKDKLLEEQSLKEKEAQAAALKLKQEEENSKRTVSREASLLRFQMMQAENGLPTFQYELGLRYLKGDGLERNETKALEWFRMAAAGGNKDAEKKLAELARK
jgi:hypothetical protein